MLERLFSEIQEWLNLGKKEKALGFFLLFLAVSGAFWTLAEPLVSVQSLSNYICVPKFISALKNIWGIIHYILSFLITCLIFKLILPSRPLQVFGYYEGETNLKANWKTVEGNVTRSEVETIGHYNKVLKFESDKDGACDCEINQMAYRANKISWIYKPESNFAFYIKVSMTTGDGKRDKNGWIVFINTITSPRMHNENEWQFPIDPYLMSNNWCSMSININHILQQTFAKQGFRYNRMIGIRIRGNGMIQNITLSK